MEQRELLRKVVRILEEMEVSYMIVGSYGSAAWGEPRFTRDIDVVASLAEEDAAVLARAFPAPEYYVSLEAIRQAIRDYGQFNVLHPSTGIKVDFIVAHKNLYGQTQLARRRQLDLGDGLAAMVAAPEDVIISKMAYYREGGSEKHLRDVTGILNVSGDDVDTEYLRRWAEQLGLMEIWQAVLRRSGEDGP